jgi:hypothetical protein
MEVQKETELLETVARLEVVIAGLLKLSTALTTLVLSVSKDKLTPEGTADLMAQLASGDESADEMAARVLQQLKKLGLE